MIFVGMNGSSPGTQLGSLTVPLNIDALTQRVEQAGQLQDNARNQFNDGHYEPALKMTRRARDMLKDALARVKKSLKSDDVLAALERTDALLARVQEQLASSDDATGKDILARARNQQARAWEEFRGERLRAALTHTRLARNLAQRALRQAGNDSS